MLSTQLQISVRTTDALRLEEAAKKLGKSLSEYVREQLGCAAVKSGRPQHDDAYWIRKRIGELRQARAAGRYDLDVQGCTIFLTRHGILKGSGKFYLRGTPYEDMSRPEDEYGVPKVAKPAKRRVAQSLRPQLREDRR